MKKSKGNAINMAKKWLLKDKKRLVGLFLVIILLGFGGYKLFGGKGNKIQYQTSQATKGTIISTVSASGSVLSGNYMPISSSASGIVSKIFVKEGDKVAKGQAIAEITLDQDGALRNMSAYTSYRSAIVSSQASQNSLRSAEASLENVLDQVKGHDSDETFAQKQQRTQAQVAKDNAYDNSVLSVLKVTQAAMDYQTSSPTIVAPMAGTVSNLTIAEGMVLTATTNSSSSTVSSSRVGTIVTIGQPLVTFNVSEIDIPRVKTGQKATITFDSLTDKTFTGKVVAVDRIGSVTSGVTNYPVVIRLDTNSDQILTNMSAAANIIINSKENVIAVPSSAVQTANGQSTVRILKGQTVESIAVETGLTSDMETEIISGINEGDVVITSTTSSTSSTNSGSSIFSGGFGGARGGGGAGGVQGH
jgi:membrane fusion protein, macrolide-specific efflux system